MPPSNPLDQVSAHDLWDAAPDGLALVDDSGCIVATNAAFDELFGYEPGVLVGDKIESLVPPEYREAHDRDRQAYERSRAARPMGASSHLKGLRADGTTFYVGVSLAPIKSGSMAMTFAAARDLTSGVEREAELAKANRLRAIAEDHDRIASELHDSTIQRLFALGLGLQGLPARIEDETIAYKIASAVDTLDEVIHEIRNTIHGLRRMPDPATGLRQRVLALISEMEPVLGFAPELRFNGDIDSVVDESIIAHLLPVIREGLSNIARHANATAAVLALTVGDEVILEIQDNGQGIKDNVVRSGLANMADRAVALSGSFIVEPADPVGTFLRWIVPSEPEFR